VSGGWCLCLARIRLPHGRLRVVCSAVTTALAGGSSSFDWLSWFHMASSHQCHVKLRTADSFTGLPRCGRAGAVRSRHPPPRGCRRRRQKKKNGGVGTRATSPQRAWGAESLELQSGGPGPEASQLPVHFGPIESIRVAQKSRVQQQSEHVTGRDEKNQMQGPHAWRWRLRRSWTPCRAVTEWNCLGPSQDESYVGVRRTVWAP